jgi:TonB family protein
MDTRSFIGAIVRREFDGFIMGWSVSDKIDPAVYWSSEPTKGRFNFVSYKNAAVDSLIDEGVSMLNRKKAKEIWSQFQDIIYEDQPYTFLIVAEDISAYHKRIKGTDEGLALAAAYTYYIPEAERRVAVATLPPPEEEVVEEAPTPERPTEETPTEEPEPERPPEIVAPEKLLEAAVKKETTTVASPTPDSAAAPPIIPLAPPKPSVITKATPTKQVAPKYPESARAIGATGRVVVRVLVGTDGNVKSATVIKSFGNPACEAAALSAAQQWKFNPATKDGDPFEQQIAIPFDFKPQ